MGKHFTKPLVNQIRNEYLSSSKITIEYLAAKYERDSDSMKNILSNRSYFDPNYTPPVKNKNRNRTSCIYIPDWMKKDRARDRVFISSSQAKKRNVKFVR